MVDRSFCPECPRALLCAGQDFTLFLPLAVCVVCAKIIELDPHNTIALMTPVLHTKLVETPLVPPKRTVCPRPWLFDNDDLFPKGAANTFLCYHCRQAQHTVSYNNGGYWNPTTAPATGGPWRKKR